MYGLLQGMRLEFGSAGAESSGPQNPPMQKVISRSSKGLWTHCTRAKAFSVYSSMTLSSSILSQTKSFCKVSCKYLFLKLSFTLVFRSASPGKIMNTEY